MNNPIVKTGGLNSAPPNPAVLPSPTRGPWIAVGESHFWVSSSEAFITRGIHISLVYPPSATALIPPSLRDKQGAGEKEAIRRLEDRGQSHPSSSTFSPWFGQCNEFPCYPPLHEPERKKKKKKDKSHLTRDFTGEKHLHWWKVGFWIRTMKLGTKCIISSQWAGCFITSRGLRPGGNGLSMARTYLLDRSVKQGLD